MTFTPPCRRVDSTRFGKPTHWYVDARGERIPGVTTILEKGVPKPALIGWAANVTAEAAVNRWAELTDLPVADRLKLLKAARYESSDVAKNRGTEIHALGDRLIQGDEVEYPDELAGHVESYVRFLDQWEPVWVRSEFSVVNYTVGYAGTADYIARMDGLTWLVDIKTGNRVYPEAALQLAAYRNAEFILTDDGEEPMPPVDRCAVIWVRADGYDLVPVVADEATFLHFRYAYRVAHWQTDLADRAVLPPLGPPDLAQEALPL